MSPLLADALAEVAGDFYWISFSYSQNLRICTEVPICCCALADASLLS
jgi:hypothetical protein